MGARGARNSRVARKVTSNSIAQNERRTIPVPLSLPVDLQRNVSMEMGDFRAAGQALGLVNADANAFGDDEFARMLQRINELEANYDALVKQVAHSATTNTLLHTPPPTDESYASLPEPGVFRAPTAVPVQLTNLGRSIRSHAAQLASLPQSRAGSPPPHDAAWAELPQGGVMSLNAFDRATRKVPLAALCNSVNVWFAKLHPMCACIDEDAFRAMLGQFTLGHELVDLAPADRLQWLALLNLIHAEVIILSDEREAWTLPAAWEDFCRAEAILSRLTWLSNGNSMTVQCLLLKARYLLHAEKSLAAYDTMGQVARYCWQLGLLCQASWSGLTDEQIAMRQRIAWTAITLDREIALLAGAPYLIRPTDAALDVPRMDLYLNANVLWAHLAADIWDTVYGTGAERPLTAERLATIEARIRVKRRQFPESLQWKADCGSVGLTRQRKESVNSLSTSSNHSNINNQDNNTAPSNKNYMGSLGNTSFELDTLVRQRLTLFQRMNILRLLLRQERMESLDFDNVFARDCIEIASVTVSATHDAYHSVYHSSLDRFFACLCLVTSLMPLICVIVKQDSTPENRGNAIDAYHKATGLLRSMEAQFSPARHGLSKLKRLLRTTERAIWLFHHEEQFMFDPSEFDTQTLIPQISGQFAPMNSSQDWMFDMLEDDLPGPFTLGDDIHFGLTPGANHLETHIDVTKM